MLCFNSNRYLLNRKKLKKSLNSTFLSFCEKHYLRLGKSILEFRSFQMNLDAVCVKQFKISNLFKYLKVNYLLGFYF